MDILKRELQSLDESIKSDLSEAITEARLLGHFFVGTEHLLRVMLKRGLNLDRDKLQKLKGLVEVLGYPRQQAKNIEITHITPAMQKLIADLRTRKVKDRSEVFRVLLEHDANFIKLCVNLLKIDLKDLIGHEFKKSYKLPPLLNKLGRDLNSLALQGKLNPLIGRDDIIRKVIQVLIRRSKNNPVLIGEPGVGKTAIVEGLAQRIVRGEVPPALKDKVIVELNVSNLVAGTKHRGEFEERLNKLIDELKAHPNIILFIDEIHTIMGAGDSHGPLDAANILKPSIARGEIKLLGATTVDEYYRYIERDPALERRFQPILVEEPTADDTVEILKGIISRYEEHHKVRYTLEALQAAVRLSIRYITDRHLPDKAIDLIDEAGALVRIEDPNSPELTVTEEVIARVVSERTGIPIGKLRLDERQKFAQLEHELRKYIFGQDDAIERVARVIKISRAGLTSGKRPYGVFLFLGPTGVGKTFFAKTLARILFDDEDALVRIDMSEFKERHEVAKLIGAPPGYIGYEQEGILTKALKTHPYCILLLDEIEKAHPEVFDLFLQVFDEGRLRDSKGRNLSFTDTVIIMTSNIGSKLIFENIDKLSFEQLRELVTRELLKFLRPELLNRVDEVVIFRPLSRDAIKSIGMCQLEELKRNAETQGVKLEFDESVLQWIIERGYSPEFGARNIRRVIQRHLVGPIAQKLLETDIKGKKLRLFMENGQLKMQVEEVMNSENFDTQLDT